MSQYLVMYLRNKEIPDMKIELGYLCTTPARTISGEGAFPYTQERVVLSSETIREYIDIMEKQIEENKHWKERVMKEQTQAASMLTKCETEIALEHFRETIDSCEESIRAADEEIEDWTIWTDWVKFCLSVATNETNTNWELCYINC